MRRSLAGKALALAVALSVVAAGCGKKKPSGTPKRDAAVVRYRLLLRENPVSPQAAFHCYGACQEQETPAGYLGCLEECPGFDTTPGITCAGYEVPPVAACFTARKVDVSDELDPGWVVLAVIAEVAIIVSLASVCASTSSGQCNPAGSPWWTPIPQ